MSSVGLALAAAAAAAAPAESPPDATTPPAVEAPAETAEPTPEDPDAVTAEEGEPVEEPAVEAEPEEAAEPEPPKDPGEIFHVAEGSDRYSEAEAVKLRKRYKLEENPPPNREPARWRCLIADPTCGISFEVNATAAYAYRGRQGDTRREGQDPRWHSGRAQYDFWLNFPVMVETRDGRPESTATVVSESRKICST